MPHLKELHEKLAAKGLVILAIHTQGAKEGVAAFVKEQAIPYLVAIDAADKESTIAACSVDSYPDYYLVDRAGRLRFADLANKEVDRAVEYLLAEPAPKPAPNKDEKEPAK